MCGLVTWLNICTLFSELGPTINHLPDWRLIKSISMEKDQTFLTFPRSIMVVPQCEREIYDVPMKFARKLIHGDQCTIATLGNVHAYVHLVRASEHH